MKLLIHAEREVFSGTIALHMAERHEGGRLYAAQPLVFAEHKESMRTFPCLRLELDKAQLLMDELWGCGLRPSEGTGSAGSLAATERHLKDMQSIAKGLLKKDGVEL